MQVLKENFKIVNTLIGFHSFTKDHNFPQFVGSLINEFSEILDQTLNTLPQIGREKLIKSADPNKQNLEIRITSNTLLFQDTAPVDEVIQNGLNLLEAWKKYSPLINLRLVGIVFDFDIPLNQDKEKNDLFIAENFLIKKDWNAITFGEFTIRFNKDFENIRYNIQLTIQESKDKNELNGIIDFNQVAVDKEHCHKSEDIARIIERAKKYFKSDLINFLNN